MSLTEFAELKQSNRKPERENHHPHFMGDVSTCNFSTGHCTNTTACHDCKVYISEMEVRKYQADFRGD